MKLNQIKLNASSDFTPHTSTDYIWTYGDPLPDLESMLDILQQYVTSIKTPAAKAASATQPMNVDDGV